jgi:glucokinase
VVLNSLTRFRGLSPSALLRQLHPLVKKRLLVWRDDHARVGVNPNFGHVLGIDLGGTHIHFALADFLGEILEDSTVNIRPEDGPRKLIVQIKEGVRGLAAKAGHGRLLAVGMGVPSPVDAERGVVAFANNLPGWKEIHLGRELQKEFRVPVFLENDANMAAIGEHWRGVARGTKNFIFIAIGTGIGSGVFIDGKLYRGRTDSAGEIYRMNLEWPRWAEDFGDAGYLETHVSGMGIPAEMRRIIPAAAEPSDLAAERDARWVFASFHKGNAAAQATLEKIFTMLGVTVANCIAVLDPDLIVLGGGIAKGAPDFMLATVEKVVRRIQPDPPPVKLSLLEDKAQTYGAVYSALALAQEAVIRHLA